MIRTFKDKDAEMLYNSGHSKKYRAYERIALRKLEEGQYSIRINDQFRICFEWNSGGAYDLEIVDYH